MCVCRAVLAAVVVSCTLSRIHAHGRHGRPAQRIDRIKDLICVLILSGMQKEDLDVNMLSKLQRHNVNIDDVNNKKLLQQCKALSSDNESTTTVQPYTTVLFTAGIVNEITIANNSHNDKAIELKKDSTSKDVIQYIDGQPSLQNVLKFWQDMQTHKSSVMKPQRHDIEDRVLNKSHSRNEQKNKRNIPNSSNLNKVDTIQQLIVNYIYQSNNKSKSYDTTTKQNYNFENNFENMYFLPTYDEQNFQNFDQNNNPKIKYQFTQVDSYHDNVSRGTQDNAHKTESVEQKLINTSKINDMIDAFKTYYPLITKTKNNVIREPKYADQVLNISGIPVIEKNLASTEKIAEQQISQNIIKEIAQSVKDMILKELRKEILVTTTTNNPTTSTRTDRIKETANTSSTNEEIIMSKFLDLFNEIKSLKQHKLTIRNEIKPETKVTKKEITIQNIPQQLSNKNINVMDSRSPGLIGYDIGSSGNQNVPTIFQLSPQVHEFRSNTLPKPLMQVQIKPAHPITVQTNNMEIAPLGIPVNEPQNPINQNIVVTMTPYRIVAKKIERHQLTPESSVGIKKNTPKQMHYLPNPQHYSINHQNYKDSAPYMLHLEDQVKPIINYNAKIGPIKYKKPNNVPHRVKPRITRFHEKLENENIFPNMPDNKDFTDIIDCCNANYAYSKQMVDCCNRNISSRHQMSLNNVKQQPSYDDTHFRNFLKSQQKVTNMLERILASRNRLPIVETA